MDRRTFLSTLAAALCAAPPANAQPPGKVYGIGYLSSGSAKSGFSDAFRQRLRELGWIEGGNVVIEYRYADGNYAKLPELAAELVARNVDILVAQPTASAVAARDATRSIPIVMTNVGDPVGIGLVKSLARPGGNVTGVAFDVALDTVSKALEILKETIPAVRRVAVLYNPGNPTQGLAIANLKVVAKSLGVQLAFFEARGRADFDGVFARIAKERADALLVVAESLFLLYRAELAKRALETRLPSMWGLRENVEAGGLISYGPSLREGARRGADFVDKILKGANPADLPVEQPTKFELVVNPRTARTLGVTIPHAVLLRADEVI